MALPADLVGIGILRFIWHWDFSIAIDAVLFQSERVYENRYGKRPVLRRMSLLTDQGLDDNGYTGKEA